MTISEACEKALKDLGGRAHLSDIYPRVLKMVKLTGATPTNSIRTEMKNHPLLFRHSPNKPRGWWELTSFQEDIATRDNRIAELEALLSAKDKEIFELKQQETADFFVSRMIDASKTVFATKRNDARPVQQVLVVMNRPEQQELMEWIIGKPTKVINKTITKKIIQKTINKGSTYVGYQTIIPNVGNYQPQITNQNLEVPMPPTGQPQEQKLLEDE